MQKSGVTTHIFQISVNNFPPSPVFNKNRYHMTFSIFDFPEVEREEFEAFQHDGAPYPFINFV